MSIRTREELLESIRVKIADDSSDETIQLLEDVTDTFDDLETKAKGDGKDWKAEAERIDQEWREKYKERFFSSDVDEDIDDEPEIPAGVVNMKYEDLFKTEE